MGSILTLIVNLIFYLAFPVADGPVWCKDSLSYTSMDCSREPFYPLFLKILRDIFGDGSLPYGEPRYLFVAVLIQSAVAAVVVWRVAHVFEGFGKSRKSRIILGLGANAAFWGVQLLNRFAALRGSAYPESIMTEGFGLSFWLLFLMAAFCFFRGHKAKDLILATLWMFLCVSLRKQLLVSCLTFAGMGFLYELVLRRKWRNFLLTILMAAIAMGGATAFDYGYNYALRGVWMQHTGNAMGMDCTLLYTTTAEDANLFPEGDVRDLFLAIQTEMEEQRIRYVDLEAGVSWAQRAGHYADAYDVIGYEIMNPLIGEYLAKSHPEAEAGSPAFYLLMDEVEEELRDGLIHQDMSRFALIWWLNICKGFVNTILRMNTLLIAAAAVLYAVYAGLLLYLLRTGGDRAAVLLASLILFSTAVNCVVVGAVIFPQTRYMIYNMGLFYAGLLLLLVENLTPNKKSIGVG